MENKNITTIIFRIKTYNSIMCGYFYFEINDLMLKGKSLLEYISLFSPAEYKNSDKIILKYVQYFIKDQNEKNLLYCLW